MYFRRAPRRDSLADLPGIETRRLRIAALAPEDAAALRAVTDDPAITGAVDFLPDPFTLEDARGLIGSGRHGNDRFLGAWSRDERRLVAVLGTHLRGETAIEIGYWVAGAARGQGVGAEAVTGIVGLLLRRFPGRLIVAECRLGNVASWGLLRKLGFRETGEDGHRPGRRVLVLERG
ncbi:GNAT family N-acetyltransferase [Methylobacterium nigriterrae]|uniref:GNAT family N-acetyltransferase n=1 Tax=Methylobacterium nigriterrae TaxID=3127512 RepID=UPI003013B25F